MTKAPTIIMYASVVSRETVRIALMIAVLNNLDVALTEILSAYMQAPVTKMCGPHWVLCLARMPVRQQGLLKHYMV